MPARRSDGLNVTARRIISSPRYTGVAAQWPIDENNDQNSF